MTNNQTNPTQKSNPCYIGKDILPRLRQREAHLATLKQARCLYWKQNIYLLMFAVFVVFTIIGVMGGLQTASLGLHSLAVTILLVALGATFLMFGAWLSLRSVMDARENLASTTGVRYGDW